MFFWNLYCCYHHYCYYEYYRYLFSDCMCRPGFFILANNHLNYYLINCQIVILRPHEAQNGLARRYLPFSRTFLIVCTRPHFKSVLMLSRRRLIPLLIKTLSGASVYFQVSIQNTQIEQLVEHTGVLREKLIDVVNLWFSCYNAWCIGDGKCAGTWNSMWWSGHSCWW